MTDQEKAIERIMDFLEDKNKQILLIKGYDEYAKIKVTLMCLNKKFTQGIIRLLRFISSLLLNFPS